MIEQIAQKLVTAYDTLSPRKKALVDMSSIFIGIALGTGLLFLAVHFNLVIELSILMISYGIWCMLKLIYQTRVSYYETLEKLNK